MMSISKTKLEALKTEYSTYTRTLHQTEQQLNRAHTVSATGQNANPCAFKTGFHLLHLTYYYISAMSCIVGHIASTESMDT